MFKILAAVVLLLGVSGAMASPIPVANGDFEACGAGYGLGSNSVPGWYAYSQGGHNTEANGNKVGYVWEDQGGGLAQPLDATFEASTRYTLSYDFGNLYSVGNATVTLLAGPDWTVGTVVKRDTYAGMPVESLTPHTIVYDVLPGDPLIGQKISIQFNGAGVSGFGAPMIDNVSLDASPIPEPATMSLVALGGLGLLRRRK